MHTSALTISCDLRWQGNENGAGPVGRNLKDKTEKEKTIKSKLKKKRAHWKKRR